MTVPAIALTAPVGPAEAPLLVLGPSLGTSTILWENVLPILADRYRVTAWDLPGHGVAPAASASFSVADLADAVAGAVRELGETDVLYAGVSLGGAVGLELLLRHDDLVEAAVIIASGAKIGEADAWNQRAAQVRTQSTSTLIIGSAQRWFAPGSIERNPGITGRLLHVLQNADDASYAFCCDALATFDVRDRLGEVDVPVLAVWGEVDEVTPESSAELIAAGVPQGSIAQIADAAHLPPVDNAPETARVLLEFFDGVLVESASGAEELTSEGVEAGE